MTSNILLLTKKKRFFFPKDFYDKTSEGFRKALFYNLTHDHLGNQDGQIFDNIIDFQNDHYPKVIIS